MLSNSLVEVESNHQNMVSPFGKLDSYSRL